MPRQKKRNPYWRARQHQKRVLSPYGILADIRFTPQTELMPFTTFDQWLYETFIKKEEEPTHD